MKNIIKFIHTLYAGKEFISLHEPVFLGNEKKYLTDCIDTTFVSSVGKYVDQFEQMCADFTGCRHAIATVNGTAGLHAALVLAGAGPGTMVITQALSFVATANAIAYTGAEPAFLDSDPDNLGMSAPALRDFLANHCARDQGQVVHKDTGKRVTACVPMHVFGHAVDIRQLADICDEFGIMLVEDAAEALGSTLDGQHLGTFGHIGVLSFNGNKTVTTGGGGMILTNDPELARQAKHLTTTARVARANEKWRFSHDQVGFNYRLPNINAALGCAQMENLVQIVDNKRSTATAYADFFRNTPLRFIVEPEGCHSNYWLNALVFGNRDERDEFLEQSNSAGIQTRPLWDLLPDLPMFGNCPSPDIENARYFADRLVNLPSGYRHK